MNLQLTKREAEELNRVLDNYVPELLFEIHRTDARAFRRDLKDEEDVLMRVRDRLVRLRKAEAAAEEMRASPPGH